jgi:AbrB family looped-hinge helix DNA binding protein
MRDKAEGFRVEDCFYGTATVGERGQIVIPADLRKALNVHPGDKLLVLAHPSGKGIMLFPVEAVREFMDMMLATLQRAESPDNDQTRGEGDHER